jgi:hypothetical protein
MRLKTEDVIRKNLSYWKNPAPNKYQEVDLEPKKGRFLVSKYSDTKLSIINPNSARF